MGDFLNNKFRARLREERERLGYTQHEFAELAGIKRVSQYLYENNDDSAPNSRYFDAIAQIGVDLHYLFFGQRGNENKLHLSPKILRDIYQIVDEVALDDKGKPLPFKARLDFFSILCVTYSNSEEQQIDLDKVKVLLK